MDIILSQRFLPERGGSIEWLINLFGEHGSGLRIITHQYSQKTENPFTESKLVQDDILLDDWGLRSKNSFLRYYRMFRLLRKELSSTEINIIHCSKIIPEGLVAVAVKLTSFKKIKIICFAHGEEFKAYQSSRELQLLYRLIIKCIDLVIANSNFTKQQLLKLPPPQKIEILHPSVKLADFETARSKADLRELYGYDQNDLILLTVGRLTARKNQLGVLQVLSNQYSDAPHVKYLIVGSGEQQPELEQYVRSHQLENRVRIITNASNSEKNNFYNLADIFLMPSIDTGKDLEGFGMVYLEAAACGLPVICGNSGGESDAISPGESGYLVEKESELIEAMEQLIKSPEKRLQFGQAGKVFVQNFSALKSYQSYRKFIESIL